MNLPDPILDLLDRPFPNLRAERFNGTGFEVSLQRFAPRDRDLIGFLYRDIRSLTDLWKAMSAAPDYGTLSGRIVEIGSGEGARAAHSLGISSRTAGLADRAMLQAIHDLRGGGLALLLGAAGLLEFVPDPQELVFHCVAAAIDHAKIMRNLIPEIDPPGRECDLRPKPHLIDHFTRKWAGAETRGQAGPVHVGVACSYSGAVAASCMETSSLDRVLYNFMNNATRFASGGEVNLDVSLPAPGLTRWVVKNAVTQEQQEFLRDRVGEDVLRLFSGGITNGGSGLGLCNCVQIVSACFGLQPPVAAVENAYLGAAVADSHFYAWFHWPALQN